MCAYASSGRRLVVLPWPTRSPHLQRAADRCRRALERPVCRRLSAVRAWLASGKRANPAARASALRGCRLYCFWFAWTTRGDEEDDGERRNRTLELDTYTVPPHNYITPATHHPHALLLLFAPVLVVGTSLLSSALIHIRFCAQRVSESVVFGRCFLSRPRAQPSAACLLGGSLMIIDGMKEC